MNEMRTKWKAQKAAVEKALYPGIYSGKDLGDTLDQLDSLEKKYDEIPEIIKNRPDALTSMHLIEPAQAKVRKAGQLLIDKLKAAVLEYVRCSKVASDNCDKAAGVIVGVLQNDICKEGILKVLKDHGL